MDVATGRVRTIIANDADHRLGREEFAISKGRMFLTLASWESDVGVMDLIQRR